MTQPPLPGVTTSGYKAARPLTSAAAAWIAAAVLCGALAAPPGAAAQAVDPNIQQRVDQFVDKPTGEQLLIKRPSQPEGKTSKPRMQKKKKDEPAR